MASLESTKLSLVTARIVFSLVEKEEIGTSKERVPEHGSKGCSIDADSITRVLIFIKRLKQSSNVDHPSIDSVAHSSQLKWSNYGSSGKGSKNGIANLKDDLST